MRAWLIAAISAMIGVSKVAPSTPATKTIFILVVIMKPRPEGEEVELQEASESIVIIGANLVGKEHSLKVLVEVLKRS